MRIRSSRLLPYALPLKRVWHSHHGSIRERYGWIVVLTADDDRQGYGDCAPLPLAGTEDPDIAETWLHDQLSAVQGQSPGDLIDALEMAHQPPAARHALETALLDLRCQAEGVSLRQWLSPHAPERINVNGSAGGLDGKSIDSCNALLEQGFSVIKLKVGLAPVADELRWLGRLCRQLPKQAKIRLDANGAWNLTEARQFLQGIDGLPVESLEEPLMAAHLTSLAELQAQTPIALALDESLPGVPLASLLEMQPVRRLIIKPTVLGGLIPAFKLATQAKQAGLETLVTSTLESAVGIHAAAQLAAAIDDPHNLLAHGLATSQWLADDLAQPPKINQGQIRLSNTPGLGIRFNG